MRLQETIGKTIGGSVPDISSSMGVPQGSILGPLIFILSINDIKNCSKIVPILLFADDTNVLYSHSNFQILQETIQIEMNKIVDWLN